jgi:oligopeptide transport system substrate-binding protein
MWQHTAPPRPSRVVAAALGIALIAMLAACTSSSTNSKSTSAPSGSGAAAGGAGGTVSVGILEPRDGIAPGKIVGGAGYSVINALFAPLENITPSGQQVMVAAQSVTTTDNKVWTIKIKPWKFQNGEPVTAQNYVDTINAAAYGPNAWGQNFRLAGVEGYAALNPAKGTPTTKTLSGVKVIDTDTFQVTLTAPNSQFLYTIAFEDGPFMPLPPEAFSDANTYADHPIGNGPFQMDGNWQHNQSIKVTRWDGYEGTKPQINEVDFKIYTQAEAEYADFQAGNLDVIGAGGLNLPSEDLPQITTTYKSHSYNPPAFSSVWLTFPMWDSRFANIDVREGISESIDRSAIAQKLLSDTVTPATGLIVPGDTGGSTQACGDKCSYNATQAKQLFQQGGGWSGSMTIYNIGYPDDVATAIANDIRQTLGVKTTIQNLQFAALQQLNSTHKLEGAFLMNWGAIPSPGDMYNGIFTTAATNNWVAGGYHTTAIDDMVAQAAEVSDVSQQTSLYHQAESAILNAFWVAPLYWGGDPVFLSPHVTHFQFDPNNSPDYNTLTVSS